jgi:predicted nucleic-acid-binding Zn-ribbon protein
MRGMPTCPKCGSTSIVERASVIVSVEGHDNSVNLRIDAKPDALFFKGAARTRLDAFTCVQCGFTEFYAREPAQLAEASDTAKLRQSVLESN